MIPSNFPSTATDSYFLSFEGIEGAGKSTQIQLFADKLKSQNFQVVLLREPGGTTFGESLREAILKSSTPLHPLSEALLFASARAQLLHEKTLPLLQKPRTIVIHDRHLDSSLAYQGVARGLGMETILSLHQYIPLNYRPHLTFYVQISLETSYHRQKLRGKEADYFESEKKEFYQKLEEGFQSIISLFPDRVRVIDGEKEESKVLAEILTHWEKFIGENQ